MFHLISHVVFQAGVPIYGPIHVIESFLNNKRKKYISLSLPLDLEGEYSIQYNVKNKTSFPSKHKSLLLKFFFDFYFVLKYIFSSKIEKKDTIIAANPLNAIPFALMKPLFGFKLIYYTVDYSDKRFKNRLLNLIYQICDWLSMLACNENWCVSNAIIKKRIEQGWSSRKLKFVPNVPILEMSPSAQSTNHRHSLIYVGRMDSNMHLPQIIKSVIHLHKTDPKITLNLIGDGILRPQIEKECAKHSYIKFFGPLNNLDVVANLKKSGIGLALYSGGNNWNCYGDSMKLREYHYFGLPVITTEIPANSEEVKEYECGKVINSKKITSKALTEAIKEIQNNYSTYSKKSLQLAIDRDKKKILEGLLGL